MPLISLHDRDTIATLLRRDPALHAYELGDLDDFYFPYTTWYAMDSALALIYHGGGFPVLLSFGAASSPLDALMTGLIPLLPKRFEAHLSPGLVGALRPGFEVTDRGPHLKMALAALTPPAPLPDGVTTSVLASADLPAILALYEQAYPGNWFDPRMLATGQYVGVTKAGQLIAIAGVHVYSPAYRVAALGNVTTHPAHRGNGYASAAVAHLCRHLSGAVETITLNVKADNTTAITLYHRLGFVTAAPYHEYTLTAR